MRPVDGQRMPRRGGPLWRGYALRQGWAALLACVAWIAPAAAAASQQVDTASAAGEGTPTVGGRVGEPNDSTTAPRDRNAVGSSGPSTLVHPPYNHTYGIHKARTSHLKLFLGGRTVFADPQGLAAVKLAQDDDPTQKGDDFQLTVLGLNAGRGEIIYNSSMQTLALFGTHGSGEGQLDRPHGIAADVNGNVYVADTGNQRVVHLVWRDRQLVWVGLLAGSYGEPWGVAAAPPGREVYVSDRQGNQVYRWTPAASVSAGRGEMPKGDGNGVSAGRGEMPKGDGNGEGAGSGWAGGSAAGGGSGEIVPLFPEGISRPTAVAIVDSGEEWLNPKEDALYVIYEDGLRLAKFDRSGTLVASTSAAERDSVRAAPHFAYLACDFYGNVWVTDTGNSTIYKFKRDLTYITSYGAYGEGDFQLVEPRGIAIWKRFGQVLVAEKEGAQYFFVGTDVLLPDGPLPVRFSGSGAEKRYVFDTFFTEPTDLTLEFLASDGSVVDSLSVPRTLDSGKATVSLGASDAVSDLEQRASRIVLVPKPTYSSRKRFVRRIERPIEWVRSP